MTPPKPEQSPVLILGIGSVLSTDDGVGVRVVQCLGERPLPGILEVADGGTSGIDWPFLMADRSLVVVVDAVDADAAGVDPGTVLRLSSQDAGSHRIATASLHGFGLTDALDMAATMGRAPGEVIVIGVAGESFEPGFELTRTIAQRVETVAEICLRTVYDHMGLSEAANG